MEIISPIIQLYLIILTGYIIAKKFNLDNKIFTIFVIYFALPSLIFYSIYNGTYDLDKISIVFIYTLVIFIVVAISYLFTKIGKYNFDDQGIITAISWYGNTGNFGMAITFFLLGEESLAIASLIVLTSVVISNTISVYFMAREKEALKKSVIKVLKLPTIYAFFIAITLNYLNIKLPNLLMSPVEIVGKTALVLPLILLGTFLADIKFEKIEWKLISPLLIIKLIVMPLIAYIIVRAVNLPINNDSLVLFIECATPLAIMSISLADLFDKKPKQLALANALSLILVIITLPIFWFLIK